MQGGTDFGEMLSLRHHTNYASELAVCKGANVIGIADIITIVFTDKEKRPSNRSLLFGSKTATLLLVDTSSLHDTSVHLIL